MYPTHFMLWAIAAVVVVPLLWKLATTHRVSFEATKFEREPVKVRFDRKDGSKVSFRAHKTVRRRKPVSFRARNK
jgi:hypothetical protein